MGLLKDLGQHDDVVTSVAFSPDGQRVVTSGWDQKVTIAASATEGQCGAAASALRQVLSVLAGGEYRG